MITSLALTILFEITGPCDKKPFLENKVMTQSLNVGQFTIETLDKHQIQYVGNEMGINTMFGTPTGMEAYEIISDVEMRAYGWCYEVDGVVPEEFANKVSLSGVKSVRWFYGYAHYLKGEWLSQCEPAYEIKPKFLCD